MMFPKQEIVEKIRKEYPKGTREGVTPETETYKWALEDNLSMQYEELDKAKKKVDQKVAQINATLNQIGKGLSDKWEIIDLPVEPVIPSEPIVDALDTALDAATEDAIKTWQEWFEQITGVKRVFLKAASS